MIKISVIRKHIIYQLCIFTVLDLVLKGQVGDNGQADYGSPEIT